MWYLWISTEFYHRHILYKSMSIDLHSLDIGGQPRNRVHRSPIRILISKEKEKPTWFDSKASNEFLYFLDSPIDCFHSHHICFYTRKLCEHGLQWTIFLSDSQSLEEESLAFYWQEEREKKIPHLLVSCSPVSTTFLNPGWIPLPFPPRYLKLGGSIRCSTGWKIVSIDLHSSVFWRYTIVGIVGGTWIKYRHKILPLAWKINLNRNSLHLIEIVPFRQNCSIIVYKIE